MQPPELEAAAPAAAPAAAVPQKTGDKKDAKSGQKPKTPLSPKHSGKGPESPKPTTSTAKTGAPAGKGPAVVEPVAPVVEPVKVKTPTEAERKMAAVREEADKKMKVFKDKEESVIARFRDAAEEDARASMELYRYIISLRILLLYMFILLSHQFCFESQCQYTCPITPALTHKLVNILRTDVHTDVLTNTLHRPQHITATFA
jgi:hypothetical protein